MALSQQEIQKSAVIAALLVQEKSIDDLRALRHELSTEIKRREYAKKFIAQLAQICNLTVAEFSSEFADDLVGRLYSNVQMRLQLEPAD